MTQDIPHPTLNAIERLKAMLGRILMDVSASVAWGAVSMPMNVFIAARIEAALRRILYVVESIRAGTYRRRRSGPRAPASPGVTPSPRPPRPSGAAKQPFGWLMPLLPMPYWNANAHRGELESLLTAPDMVALIAAAPVSLGRPLRSLCWMFRLKPPQTLAPKRQPPPPPKPEARSAAPAAPPQAAAQHLPSPSFSASTQASPSPGDPPETT